MRRFFLLPLLCLLTGPPVFAAESPGLRVLAYDSLTGRKGWLEAIKPTIESTCQVRLSVLAPGDAGQMATRLKTEGEKLGAGAAIGVDLTQWELIRPYIKAWDKWKPEGFDRLRPETLRAAGFADGFLPFDYGPLTLMSDVTALKKLGMEPPAALTDLRDPRWKGQVALEDPRTSTPGSMMLMHSYAVFGREGFTDFWKASRPAFAFIAGSWDQAYGAFMEGRVPLVWSYWTSEAYHRAHGESARYRALDLREGLPVQVEGAVILKSTATDNPAGLARAQCLLNVLIGADAQAKIPETNWMLPVRADAPLPPSFRALTPPRRLNWELPELKRVGGMRGLIERWQAAVR